MKCIMRGGANDVLLEAAKDRRDAFEKMRIKSFITVHKLINNILFPLVCSTSVTMIKHAHGTRCYVHSSLHTLCTVCVCICADQLN